MSYFFRLSNARFSYEYSHKTSAKIYIFFEMKVFFSKKSEIYAEKTKNSTNLATKTIISE